jgi:neutrophil factor 2
MSLKKELQTWSDALDAYDTQQWDNCIDLFDVHPSLTTPHPSPLTLSQTIADSSKILFNIGVIQATTGAHEMAVQSFETAIGMDRYLAVAYFQSGVSNFLLGAYEYARRDFEDCYEVSYGRIGPDATLMGVVGSI